MSPEDLRHLRRRLRLTQVQFAARLGVSPALVASLECGRRRITERRAEEIARLLRDNLDEPQFLPVQKSVRPPAQQTASPLVSKFVPANQPDPVRVANPASVPKPVPLVAWSKCTWRDPELGRCGGLTPQGMLYCAVHMALAMIEGRPTRRR